MLRHQMRLVSGQPCTRRSGGRPSADGPSRTYACSNPRTAAVSYANAAGSGAMASILRWAPVTGPSRAYAEALDAADPLAGFRDRFVDPSRT